MPIALDEVVLTANRSQTLRREAPALVNVLDSKLFDQTNAMCMAQGLNFQPGVRTEDNCQNCGFHRYASMVWMDIYCADSN